MGRSGVKLAHHRRSPTQVTTARVAIRKITVASYVMQIAIVLFVITIVNVLITRVLDIMYCELRRSSWSILGLKSIWAKHVLYSCITSQILGKRIDWLL